MLSSDVGKKARGQKRGTVPRPPVAGLPGAIVEALGKKILNGELVPGDTLPAETVYLNQLGVSRTTLREAIKVLSAKGLVLAKPKTGTVVRAREHWNLLDPAVLTWEAASDGFAGTMAELFEIRRLVEPEGAALAARRHDDGDAAAMQAAFEALAPHAHRGIDALDVDIAFHLTILKAAGNRYLSSLGAVIDTVIRSTARLALNRPGGLGHSMGRHQAVLDAVLARDEPAARAAMHRLLSDAEEDAQQVLERGQ
jgi:GntR family transcriptional regulator, galactonate operon transcriptional repressor